MSELLNPKQNKEVQKRLKEIFRERYGADNPFKSKECREKAKQTFRERYGVEYFLQSKEGRRRYKKTLWKKYGVTNISRIPEVKKKKKDNMQKKYGVDNPSQIEGNYEKVWATMVERYGDDPLNHPDIIEKRRQTCLEIYGADHFMQSPEFVAEFVRKLRSVKDYNLGGKIIQVQGYEPYALDYLQKEKGIKPHQIKTGFKKVPRIPYTFKGNNHYYFPDIFLPHINRIIEVKSEHTLNIQYAKNMAKKRACEKMGYKFSFLVMDSKGNRLIV